MQAPVAPDALFANPQGREVVMMLEAETLPEGYVIPADICIVGAGAAGISLALELIGSGLDVVLLESGGLKPERATQALYGGTVADPRLHSPPDRYRQRCFGGSTTIWGGRCTPLDPIDFEKRPWLPHSGWPIGPEALAPHYARANRLCEAGECSYTAETAFSRPLPPVIDGFASLHFTVNTLERFSCPTDFGGRYAHKLRAATNLRVILHANVTRLELDPDGRRVERVGVRRLDGSGFSVEAGQVVLATGGLEVPRLLLANRDVHRHGIGNDHDVVGRYYMCHLAGTIGRVILADPAARAWNGYDIADDGTYCRRRFALTAETQRLLGLGGFVARLHHPRITDPTHRTGVLSLLYLAKPFIPYEYAKRLHGEDARGLLRWLQHVVNVLRDPLGTVGFLWHWLRDRSLAARKFPSIVVRPRAAHYSLDFHAEQLPNPDSRVTLGSEHDALGLPRLHVDWRYTRADLESVQQGLALFAEDLQRCGAGRFEYDPQQVELEMTRYGAYGGHHIGTARMGSDPRSSVVDADCRVHGMDNLYVAGSAVFPTSSQANPTLNIVALALRLAQHLRWRAQQRRPLRDAASGIGVDTQRQLQVA